MNPPKIKPCRICGAPVTPKRRTDKACWHYPRQCKACYYQPRDPELRRERQRDALASYVNHRQLPLGTRRIRKIDHKLLYAEIKIGPTGKEWEYEHRLVIQSVLGRALLPNEQVHHINHDTMDNRPENLVALDRSAHISHHHNLRGIAWSMHFTCCITCGTTERPHLSKGMCGACYQRTAYAANPEHFRILCRNNRRKYKANKLS